MEGDDTYEQPLTAALHPQKVIPPGQYFPFERLMLYVAITCFAVGALAFIFFNRVSFLHFPFMSLSLSIVGIGIILLAFAMIIAEAHFRHSAVPVLAKVTRGEQIVEDYYSIKANTKDRRKDTQYNVMTVEVQFTAQSGEEILLEIPASYRESPEVGQFVRIFCLLAKPQVASSFEGYISGLFPTTVFYCLVGVGCIILGFTVFR